MHQGACAVREVDLETSLRAFHPLPMGVAVWQLQDAGEVRSLRFVGVNPAAERELRAPLGFAVGKPITECFPKLLDTPIPEQYEASLFRASPETFGEFDYGDSRIPEGVFWVDCFPVARPMCRAWRRKHHRTQAHDSGSGPRLQLLHRITLFLNDAPTALEAAQFCIDEICAQIGWPVGRFFLSDDSFRFAISAQPGVALQRSAVVSRLSAKPPNCTNSNVTNRLALEYRTIQGQKAGLTKSVGFKVVENDFLRGVLEFSSESCAPLDEHIFRAISNIGFQLGQVFARERLGRRYGRLQELHAVEGCGSRCDFEGIVQRQSVVYPTAVASLETHRRSRKAIVASSKDIVESTIQMRKHLDELQAARGQADCVVIATRSAEIESAGSPFTLRRFSRRLASRTRDDCQSATPAQNSHPTATGEIPYPLLNVEAGFSPRAPSLAPPAEPR